MNALRNWRAYLPNKERLYLLLAVSGIAALALGIFAFVALSLVPTVRTRTELIAVVATAEQNVIVAETVQAAAPARARAEVATAQAAVNEAARGFLSEAQAAAALNHLYQYARESGVTIVELQAQAAPQGAGANVYRLITFGLRVTGALPRLVNFLARIREATLSGFVINNVSITEDKAGDGTNAVASMNVDIYTSPYADTAATQPITGMPTLPLLPTLTPAIPLPGVTLLPGASLEPAPTLPFTVTMIPTLAPAGTHTPIVTGQPTPLTPVIIATTAVAPATIAPTAIAPTAIVPTPLPTTPVACAVLVANGDFEVDGAWIIGQSVKPPQFTSSQKHAGARAMQLGSPPESGALNRGSYSSIRQLITIPASASIATLRWWHLFGSAEAVATDPGGTSDRQEVLLLRPDEKVLAVLQRVRRNDGVWQQETLDLSAYRGQSVYLYFNVFNDGNGAPTWMYVDDVQLDTCVATPVPTAGTPVATVATNTPIVTAAPTTTPTTPVTAAVTPTATPSPTVLANCTDYIINGGFESDGNWIIGPSPKPPQITNSQKHSGLRAMQLGNTLETNENPQSYSSVRQLVNIPADASSVTLRWWHFDGTSEAVPTNLDAMSDRQEVLIWRADEMPLTIVRRERRNDNEWQQENVDLTAYRGQNIYFYFNVFNDGSGGSTWMYLDDVQLEVCTPGLTPMPSPTLITATATLLPTTPTAESNRGIQFGEPVVFDGGFKTVGVLARNTTNLVKSFTVKITYKNGEQILATAEGIVNDLLPNRLQAVLLFPRNDIPTIYETARIDIDMMWEEAETTVDAETARKITFGPPSIIDNAGSVTLYVEVKNNDTSASHSFDVQAIFTQGDNLVGIGSGTVNDLAPGQIKTASLFVRGVAASIDSTELTVGTVYK